jgi:hypothetical protein
MNHPPFRPALPIIIPDASSMEGAHRLARFVEATWRDAGHRVRAEVIPEPGSDGRFTYRLPDLINGLPRPARRQ